MQTDLAIDPAGNFWVMNNWQDIDSYIGTPKEAVSSRCGGQGVVVFYGMAKPVRAPQIGPAQQPQRAGGLSAKLVGLCYVRVG